MPEIAIEPRPGDSVGPYRITRTIWRGRMGVVFEGVADGGDPVAIKVVTTELSQDEVFVRRFQREVAAAQKISHPHVVPVLGAGEEGGLPYLVQALIAGGSLHDRLVKEGSLNLATTVKLLRGRSLEGPLLAGFEKERDRVDAQMNTRGGSARVSEVTGGTPYGASCVTGVGDTLRMPTPLELRICRYQGEHVAKTAARLQPPG